MLKMILKDQTEIQLAEAGIPQHYVVNCEGLEDFRDIEDAMTAENISEIEIRDGEQTLQKIVRSTLAGTQTAYTPDGTITGHIYMTGGEFVQQDAEYAAAGRILLGEEE